MTGIEFEATPNPDALRVRADRALPPGPPRQFDRTTAGADPLADALLAIHGVVRVMIAEQFVTVVRDGPETAWEALRPDIAFAIADAPDSPAPQRSEPAAPLGEIEQQIEDVLDRWVRPMLAADGGDALLVRFDSADGTAWVRMEGACGGCPSGSITLKRGIEQSIRRWVPEVTRVSEAAPQARDESVDPKARFRAWIAAKWGAPRAG